MKTELKEIVTYELYFNELNAIEQHLRSAITVSEKILLDFQGRMDHGDLADKALFFVLTKNLDNAREALNEFLRLPLY